MSKEIKFHTKWNRTKAKPEKNSGEILTDQTGYIPPNIQIMNMMRAGERLDMHRHMLYDRSVDNSELPAIYGDKLTASEQLQRIREREKTVLRNREAVKRFNEKLLKDAKPVKAEPESTVSDQTTPKKGEQSSEES